MENGYDSVSNHLCCSFGWLMVFTYETAEERTEERNIQTGYNNVGFRVVRLK